VRRRHVAEHAEPEGLRDRRVDAVEQREGAVDVAGTYAMFDGVDSPITQTFGLGLFADASDAHLAELDKHVLAMESDNGVFKPTGFGFSGTEAARRTIQEIATLLHGIGADTITASGGGADIGPSVQAASLPALSLDVDGNYFLVHHTAADTIDRIDPGDMAKASAAIAVMAYVVADMPQKLK